MRVPASSANLGPGFDVLAVALSLWLEVEVTETGDFAVEAPGHGDDLPLDRSNLCVRAFERLSPVDGLRFRIASDIPLARGLGSSASAIVAGLMAADHMYELGLSKAEIFDHAVALEGHPDNVAAATFGGFVACAFAADDGPTPPPLRIDPPDGIEAVVAIPFEEVSTAAARAAMPATVDVADAVHNVAAAARLTLGLERSDPGLIAQGLGRPPAPARPRRSLPALDRARRGGVRPRRDRSDDLGGRSDGPRLELLAGHGRRPGGGRALGGGTGPRSGGSRSARSAPTSSSSEERSGLTSRASASRAIRPERARR